MRGIPAFVFAFSLWVFVWFNDVGFSNHSFFYGWMYKLQVIVGKETFHGISGLSFVISLSRATVAFNSSAILALHSGLVYVLSCLTYYLFFPVVSRLPVTNLKRFGAWLVMLIILLFICLFVYHHHHHHYYCYYYYFVVGVGGGGELLMLSLLSIKVITENK